MIAIIPLQNITADQISVKAEMLSLVLANPTLA